MGMGSRAVLAALLVSALPTAALAQRADDRFYGRAGAFFSSIDSGLKLDGTASGNIGTDLDLESDIGLAKEQVQPFGLIGWRFTDNWRVELEYFALSRRGDIVLDESISVGDTVYDVNAALTSGLETDFYRLAIGYSFVNHKGLELGADLGFHLSDFSVFVEGVGSVNGGTAAFDREERSQLVPLPTLGLYGRVDIDETFALNARADYFALKIDAYRGQLIDLSAGVTARVKKNFGIGAELRYVDYRLRADADDFTGRVNYSFYGPFVFLEVGF